MKKLEEVMASRLSAFLKEKYCFTAIYDDLVIASRILINEYESRVYNVLKANKRLDNALDVFWGNKKITPTNKKQHSATMFRNFLSKNYWVFIFKRWW